MSQMCPAMEGGLRSAAVAKSPSRRAVSRSPRKTRPALEEPSTRDQRIVASLSLVRILARAVARRLPPSVEVDDLISAGTVGLVQAAGEYRPELGIRFNTFAEHRIRGAMFDDLRDWDHVSRTARKKTQQMDAWRAEAGQRLGRAPCDATMMDFLGMDREKFYAFAREAVPVTLVSLEELITQDDVESDLSGKVDLADSTLVPPREKANREQLYRIVADAIDALPERHRLLLSLYYFEEMKMHEIAEILGVTESRVSQIHKEALLRLRKQLTQVVEWV